MAKQDLDEEKQSGANTCALCGSSALSDVIDFGHMALAGGFLTRDEFSEESVYPLVIIFCNDCYAVQVRDHVDPDILFKTDFYFSSSIKTLRDHFREYAREVVDRFVANPSDAVVVEFGSNDGVLLRPLADQGLGTVIGVDPAENILASLKADRFIAINDFFDPSLAETILADYGPVDLVMANNVYAHISDINGATAAVERVLKQDGVFIFEVHYLGKILHELQYDMMYHEHVYYYSLLALENHLARHNMVVFDVKPISTHGGSVRYYATRAGSRHAGEVSASVLALRKKELGLGYDRAATYEAFALRVASRREELMRLICDLRRNGKTIAGYGASGRANTMIQYCGITDEHLDFMVDDAPAKQGLYTPGSHLAIRSRASLAADNPDHILLFAWSFYDEIIAKNQQYIEGGGRIIIPLPEVKLVEHP